MFDMSKGTFAFLVEILHKNAPKQILLRDVVLFVPALWVAIIVFLFVCIHFFIGSRHRVSYIMSAFIVAVTYCKAYTFGTF